MHRAVAPLMAWHFLPADLRLGNGDGREVRVGETLRHDGPLVLCESGLHASERILDALGYATGPVISRVRCGGEILRDTDKLVCRERTVEWMLTDTDDLSRGYSRVSRLDGRMVGLHDQPLKLGVLCGPGGGFITGQTIHVNGGDLIFA